MVGIIKAYESLYHPETDPNKVETTGSESDLETDKRALESLTNFSGDLKI